MKRFWKVISGFSVTLLGMTFFMHGHIAVPGSVTKVMGMPVLMLGATEPAWIAFGGVGVLVVGPGVGIVALGFLAGAGLLIGIGFIGVGGIAIGGFALGIVQSLGLVGVGLQVQAGQGKGARAWLFEIPKEPSDEPYFKSMWQELSEVISLQRDGER